MRVIIPAAGEGRRRGMHGGIRKHRAVIAGEAVLARLIRLAGERGHRPVVLCHPKYPYGYPDADYAVVEPGGWRNDVGKLAVTRPWWSSTGQTLIVFGDVFLTDAAAEQIFAVRSEWTMYGRLSAYRFGRKARSQFGLTFLPHEHRMVWRHIRAVNGIAPAANAGAHGGLRKWYQSATGQVAGPKPTVDRGHLVTIDDQSDDIDRPKHLRMIRRAVADADA